jgi:hypothetical protein
MAYEMAKKLILEKREEKKSPEVEAPKSWLP